MNQIKQGMALERKLEHISFC